jgi:hypothetical protein
MENFRIDAFKWDRTKNVLRARVTDLFSTAVPDHRFRVHGRHKIVEYTFNIRRSEGYYVFVPKDDYSVNTVVHLRWK